MSEEEHRLKRYAQRGKRSTPAGPFTYAFTILLLLLGMNGRGHRYHGTSIEVRRSEMIEFGPHRQGGHGRGYYRFSDGRILPLPPPWWHKSTIVVDRPRFRCSGDIINCPSPYRGSHLLIGLIPPPPPVLDPSGALPKVHDPADQHVEQYHHAEKRE